MRKYFCTIVIASLLIPTASQADKSKEFFTSVIYGTLAGALVGAATLAFTTNPGDNLNNVSRGASYGLYAGILLGAYVTYALDNSSEEKKPVENEENLEQQKEDSKPDSGDGESRFQELPKTQVKLAFKPYVLFPTYNSGWGGGAQLIEVKF